MIVGIPRRIPTGAILTQTFDAIAASSLLPSRVIVIDNIDESGDSLPSTPSVHVVKPQQNLGCAASWNLLHRLAAPESIVLLNDDCAVAPDTFEKMYADAATPIVCAYGFSCVRIDQVAWIAIGDFDEGFFPAYFEDTDYRRRAALAGVPICEWDTYPRTPVSSGRERSAQGIAHGKSEPDEYRSPWFKSRVEANKARYAAKWGGSPGHETYRVPFDGAPA
jgi:hypothetical protein